MSEDLVGLALFDDNVSAQTKDEMVAVMTNKEGEESPLKRVNIDLRSLNCATLVDFTTKNSEKIFTKLSLPQDFLDIPAADWSESPEFQEAKAAVDSLAVVNDHAERGVALPSQHLRSGFVLGYTSLRAGKTLMDGSHEGDRMSALTLYLVKVLYPLSHHQLRGL